MTTKTTVAQPADASGGEGGERTGGMSLLVMSAEAFASFPLPYAGTVVLGRSSKCDVQVDDPLASRRHAQLHIGDRLEVEDLDSANRTFMRDRPLLPGVRAPFVPGEIIAIGETVLVVESGRRSGSPRRIWSHHFFEARVREECRRPDTKGGAFALVRLHLEKPLSWVKVVPMLDRDVAPRHLFAAYGPNDYELLLFELAEEDAARIADSLCRALLAVDVPARAAIAWYPRDGRTCDALLAKANLSLRPEKANDSLPLLDPDGPSAAMRPVYDLAMRAAKSPINILILGETGAGKEVMAHTIHRFSPRASQAFLPINCAGLSEGLLESELFGYEKGAFTGAVQPKKGLFEAAEGGTLFLDEVGEMPLAVQSRVLRAIANREILPLGALKPHAIDVRIVAATNRDLKAEVARGTFRRDLYYRLEGLTLTVPPLRDRLSELPALVSRFLSETAAESGRAIPTLSSAALQILSAHSWPGNVRELRNVIERAMALSDDDIIQPEHLSLSTAPMDAVGEVEPAARRPQSPHLSEDEEEERKRILVVLRMNVWNQSRAAKALNMPRRTFIAKLDRYGIPRPQKGSSPISTSLPDPGDDDTD